MRQKSAGRRWRLLVAVAVLVCGIGATVRPSLAGPFEEGVVFFQGGHYRWALEKFLMAVDQAPRASQPRWYLAETYRRLGESVAAAHEYRLLLRLTPQDSAARRALAELGEPTTARIEVPVQRAGNVVLLPARLNGTALGALVLDTGATYLTISQAAAERLGVRGSGGNVHLLTANGQISAPLALLAEVDIGGATARHVPAVIHDLPNAPPSIIGLLGLSFLERFRVNLDLTAGLLILEAGE